MAVPVFVDAGAGVSSATGTTLTPACPATVDANDFLLLHAGNRWDHTIATPSGWSVLSGNLNWTGRSYVFYKVADGSEDGATVSVVNSGSNQHKIARIYRLTGVLTSGTPYEALTTATDSGSGVLDVGVTTTAADRLAINAIIFGRATTLSAFTGETGGDWTEAVAEYPGVGVDLCLGLQIANMASAGTINGGAFTAGASSGNGIHAFALLPEGAAAAVVPSLVMAPPIPA